jgi:hypothetical protein
VGRLYGALERKAQVDKKRKSAAKKDKIVYVQVDTPIPQLGDSKRTPLWAIDPNWLEKNDQDCKTNRHLVLMSETEVPYELEEFITQYGEKERTYVKERPTPVNPVPSSLDQDLLPAIQITSIRYRTSSSLPLPHSNQQSRSQPINTSNSHQLADSGVDNNDGKQVTMFVLKPTHQSD